MSALEASSLLAEESYSFKEVSSHSQLSEDRPNQTINFIVVLTQILEVIARDPGQSDRLSLGLLQTQIPRVACLS